MDAEKNLASDAMSRLQGGRILFLHNPKADPYGTHRTSIATYAGALARLGIGALSLDISTADFMSRLGEIATRPDVVAIHCEQSWGLDLGVQVSGRAVDVFEYLNKPAIAHIRDYPFYPWLRGRLLTQARNRLLFFTEKSAVDFVTPFRGAARHDNHYAFAPHIYLDDASAVEGTPLPWGERPIPLLYVGSYADPAVERDKFAQAQPRLAPLLESVIEAAIDNHAAPFWKIADGVVAQKGFAADHTNAAYLDLLVAANQFIRNERRRRLLENLAPYPMHLVWSGPKPDIALHPDTIVTRGNTLAETLALCRQAKAMVMCLNSFSYSLSERLLSAMERGAAALCIRNAMIDKVFTDGEDILALDGHGDNLAAQMARLREPGFGEKVTAAARAKVLRDFSPDVRAAQFVSALERFYGARA